MAGSWSAAAWRVASVLLGVGAVVAAACDHRVVFDLPTAGYSGSVERFAAGLRDVEIDPLAAGAAVPYVLPGPADDWAGATPHALRFTLARAPARRVRLELRTVETHHTAPPRLAIAAGGVTRHLQTAPGTGLPPPHGRRGTRHRYDVTLDAAAEPGPWTLAVVNEAGSWVMWERIRLVDEARTLALAYLGRPGPLPPASLALLAASLAVLLPGAMRGPVLRAAGPALALLVVALGAELARQGSIAFQPRWLSLALPWFCFATHAGLGRLSPAPSSPARARARAAIDAVMALLAIHVLLGLFAGGHSPIPGVIAILALLVLRIPVACGTSWRALAEHKATVVFAAALIVYLANGRFVGGRGGWDTRGARLLAFSVLREADFDLDEYRPLLGDVPPGYVRVVDGRLLSGYPVGAALLALPFFVPAALADLSPDSPAGADAEKLASATLVALSVVLVHLTARRLTTRPLALAITATYAFGTSTLSTSSQGLWQHTAVQPALATAVYALLRARAEPRWLALAGFASAFAVVSRPAAVLLALPLAAYVLLHHRRHGWRFLLAAGLPAVFQVWYDLAYFGDLLHSHLPTGVPGPQDPSLWDTPLAEGLAGVLLSPARGLFVYSPVALLGLLGIGWASRTRGDPLLRWLGLGAVATILLYAKWHYWWGGPVYGPRILGDADPVLVLGLAPLSGLIAARRPVRALFGIALGWSVLAHGIGAFADDLEWNYCQDYRFLADRMWSWSDNQLVNPPKEALVRLLAPPTSRTHPRQLAAAYRVDGPPPPHVGPGQPIEVVITARNTGGSVWLAHSPDGHGVVSLGWRWTPAGPGAPAPPERLGICSDVLPGTAGTLRLVATSPDVPGDYVLEMGLASEGTPSFADLGTSPVRARVTVQAGSGRP